METLLKPGMSLPRVLRLFFAIKILILSEKSKEFKLCSLCVIILYINYNFNRRTVAELLVARDAQAGKLVSSYKAYDDLLLKVAKGLEFYFKLDTSVSMLLDQTKDLIQARKEERESLKAAR